MIDDREEHRNVIRRRRTAGILVLVVFVGFGLAINGWQYSPIKWLWDWQQLKEGTFVAGDPYGEWVYTYCDGNEQQVAVLVDGQIKGAEALDSLRTAEVPTRCDLPLADHPELAAWQTQLEQLTDLTAGAEAQAETILTVALGMPISSFYLRPVSQWIEKDPRNASAFLDALSNSEPDFRQDFPAYEQTRRDNLAAVTALALGQVTSASPAQVHRWIASSLIAKNSQSVETFVRLSATDLEAKRQLLENLRSFKNSDRTRYYLKLGVPLVHDARYAPLLVKQIELLARGDRLDVTRELLNQSDSSAEFTTALLSKFDELFYGAAEEFDAFVAIANEIKNEEYAPKLLAKTLKDLEDAERRRAAIYLVSLDGPTEERYTLNVLDEFDELHPVSKPRVLKAVILSPQFQQASIQQACLDIVQFKMEGSDRTELLTQMAEHDALDSTLQSRIRIALGG